MLGSLMCNLSKEIEDRGIAKGIEKEKIYGTIEICRELDMPDGEILKKLCQKFSLSKEDALEYLEP